MYIAADTRYDSMPYRRVGASGLVLPSLSLGLWHNFGDDVAFANQRAIVRRAFDLGITHFDLANNYGPRYLLCSPIIRQDGRGRWPEDSGMIDAPSHHDPGGVVTGVRRHQGNR